MFCYFEVLFPSVPQLSFFMFLFRFSLPPSSPTIYCWLSITHVSSTLNLCATCLSNPQFIVKYLKSHNLYGSQYFSAQSSFPCMLLNLTAIRVSKRKPGWRFTACLKCPNCVGPTQTWSRGTWLAEKARSRSAFDAAIIMNWLQSIWADHVSTWIPKQSVVTYWRGKTEKRNRTQT